MIGAVKFADGSKFEGFWENDAANGLGRLQYQNGDYYEGNYICSIKEGEGIYVFA